MSSFKLSHICSNFDKFYLDFMEQQKKMQIDFRVFYFRSKDRGMPKIKEDYLDIRLNYKNWHRAFFHLKAKLVLDDYLSYYKDTDFDLLHAHTLYSNGYIAYKLNKEFNIPYIVAVRDMDVNIFLKNMIHLRRTGVDIMKNAEKVIFISENYKQHTLEKYVPSKYRNDIRNKSVIIPNGINDFYLNNSYKREELPRKESLIFITVGYISKRKNQLLVCKAIEKLNAGGYNIKYKVVGKILDNDIFEKINKYPFVEYVPFLPKEELIQEYRSADIFVLPSKTETFGLTYIEAMTQGLPVLYTKSEGFDSYFNNGIVGYSVSSSDETDIITNIPKILNKYLLISDTANLEAQKFNWPDIELEYRKIYEEIVS